ncbi:MAG: hypothetical protein ACXWCY_09710 [Burkholderiales bacterium]
MDNRCTMHRGTEFDDLRWLRDKRRATVSDVATRANQPASRFLLGTEDYWIPLDNG